MKNIIFISIILFFTFQVIAQSNFIGSGIALHYEEGEDNFISLGDAYNDLDFPFSFESWIKVYDLPSHTHGLFASDNEALGNYYGCWIRITDSGKLQFEIGNGMGSGTTHRKGRETISSVPYEEWVHVAIVANSSSEIDFFFNGVLQENVSTGGGASITSLLHNDFNASIGRYTNIHRTDQLVGYMDEIRLWNIALTEDEVRTNLCQKISPETLGLMGYWNVDESFDSDILTDVTISVDGALVGEGINRVLSGAPIGNAGTFIYTNDWADIRLSLDALIGDRFVVSNISNNPYGIHLYRVESAPYSVLGLTDYAENYFGVFTANNEDAAVYSIKYRYSYSNGIVTHETEDSSSLMKRMDGSDELWSLQETFIFTEKNAIVRSFIPERREYIFNLSGLQDPGKTYRNQQFIHCYPNPTTNRLLIDYPGADNSEVFYTIWNLKGNQVGSGVLINPLTELQVSTFPAGQYYIQFDGINSSGAFFIKE